MFLSWYTDIYLPDVGDWNDELKETLRDPSGFRLISERIEDRGNVTYHEFVIEPLSKDALDRVNQLLSRVAFEPLYFTAAMPKFLTLPEESLYFIGLREYLTEVLPRDYGFKVDHIVQHFFQDYVTLRPEEEDGTLHYLPPAEGARIRKECNLDEVSGYRVLSSSPLAEYASKMMGFPVRDLKKFRGLLLYPYRERISQEDFSAYISGLEQDRVFALPNDPIFEEIADLWDSTVLEHEDQQLILRSNLKVPNPKEWFLSARRQIQEDSLPLFTVAGSWTQQLELETRSRRILLFAAYLSYLELSTKKQPLLYSRFDSVRVHQDLTVTAAFFEYSDVEFFASELYRLILNASTWTLRGVSDDIEGMIFRWRLKQSYPDLLSMVLGDEEKMLIVNSSGKITMPEIKEGDLDAFVGDFNRSYPSHKLERMTDFLSLISQGERIFSIDELEKKELPSREEKSLIELHPLGVGGLFRIGIVPGLMEEPPVPVRIRPADGGVALIEYDDGKLKAEVVLKNLTKMYLFEVYSRQIEDLFHQTNRLWKMGWFINPWSQGLSLQRNRLSERPLRRIPEIFTYKGDLLLKYLKSNL